MKQRKKKVTVLMSAFVLLLQLGCTDTEAMNDDGITVLDGVSESEQSMKAENLAALAEVEAQVNSVKIGVTKVRLPSIDEAKLIRQSFMIAAQRRSHFHIALADRLELTGETREQFIALLDERQALRMNEADAAAAGEALLADAPESIQQSLMELLGEEKHETYNELRETRREWYSPSQGRRVGLESLTTTTGSIDR
jgi:hypothetical protein